MSKCPRQPEPQITARLLRVKEAVVRRRDSPLTSPPTPSEILALFELAVAVLVSPSSGSLAADLAERVLTIVPALADGCGVEVPEGMAEDV